MRSETIEEMWIKYISSIQPSAQLNDEFIKKHFIKRIFSEDGFYRPRIVRVDLEWKENQKMSSF